MHSSGLFGKEHENKDDDRLKIVTAMKWPLTKSVLPTVNKTQDVYITRRLVITLADKVNTVLLSIKQKRLK